MRPYTACYPSTPNKHNRESANEILEEYFKKIGGRESIFKQTESAARGKKRGRKPSSATAASAEPTPTKRSRKVSNGAHPGASTPPASSKAWGPPAGSWEDDIEAIDACQDEGSGQLMVYLVWKNGKKTRHTTAVVYKKCPQKVSAYYQDEGQGKGCRDWKLTGGRCCNSTKSTLRLSSPKSSRFWSSKRLV